MDGHMIYQCKLCSCLFIRSQDLAAHVRIKHKNEEYPKRPKKVGSSRGQGQRKIYMGGAIVQGLSGSSKNEQPPRVANANAPLLGSVLDLKFIEARPQFFHPICSVPTQDEVNEEKNAGCVDLELRLGIN